MVRLPDRAWRNSGCIVGGVEVVVELEDRDVVDADFNRIAGEKTRDAGFGASRRRGERVVCLWNAVRVSSVCIVVQLCIGLLSRVRASVSCEVVRE